MLLTAHSGSDGTPENSLLFIESMLAYGVSCIEVDVRKKDAILYLNHDPIDKIDAHLTLDEAFASVSKSSHTAINCDLKEDGLEEEVMQYAEKYDLVDRLILSGTVSIQKIKEPFKKDHVFFNPENILPDFYTHFTLDEAYLKPLVTYCQDNHIAVINVNYRIVTEEFIRIMHREGIKISVWTVNKFEKIDQFKKWKIHNTTTREACAYMTHKNMRRSRVDRVK